MKNIKDYIIAEAIVKKNRTTEYKAKAFNNNIPIYPEVKRLLDRKILHCNRPTKIMKMPAITIMGPNDKQTLYMWKNYVEYGGRHLKDPTEIEVAIKYVIESKTTDVDIRILFQMAKYRDAYFTEIENRYKDSLTIGRSGIVNMSRYVFTDKSDALSFLHDLADVA